MCIFKILNVKGKNMENNFDDLELVNQVKYENSSEALRILYHKFLPITESIMNRYFIRDFDEDDWRQEFLIVCHETCFRYKGEQGSKFGNFYKLRLENHARSLLRRELALKRKINKEASSFEGTVIPDAFDGRFIGSNKGANTFSRKIDLTEFFKQLNYTELEVFKMLLGQQKMEDIDASINQIRSALYKCKKKLRLYLAN